MRGGKDDGCKEEGAAGAYGQSALPVLPICSYTEAKAWEEDEVPRPYSKWLLREINCFTSCKTETTVGVNTSVMIAVLFLNK